MTPTMTPDTHAEGFAALGRLSDAELRAGVTRQAVGQSAGRLWWAAQSPVLTPAQRTTLLRARERVLAEIMP